MIELRPYQHEAVRSVWQYFIQGGKGNPIVAMPTGTGKSLVIGGLVRSILETYPTQRVLILTHVKELIAQNTQQIRLLWPNAPVGVYSSGLKSREVNVITVAGIQSVHKRARLFQGVDIVIIDECHLVSPNGATTYRKFLDELMAFNPKLKVVGLTATAYRLSTGMLTDNGIFTDVCLDQTAPTWFQYFISNGWLAPLVPKHMDNTLDTDKMRVRGGEFLAADVMHEMNSQRLTLRALQEAVHVARERKCWMVFASSVEHAEECHAILSSLGVRSNYVHSKMSSQERDENIRQFKAGEVRCIINRDILTTGFDVKEVDCIIVLRPTQSPALWVQMLGRGTRPAPGKTDCLVLDFAGNTARLGPIDRPNVPKKKGAGGEPPVRVCPDCATYLHISLQICPHCGHEFPAPEQTPKITDKASNLALLSSNDMPQMEVFSVHSMIGELAQSRKDGTAMLRVNYYCGDAGVRRFNMYLCFDHTGYAKRKAAEWWRQHSSVDDGFTPDSTAQAVAYFNDVRRPSHVRVWVNTKYPEIKAYDFTGTAFGEQDAVNNTRGGAVAMRPTKAPAPVNPTLPDDEIPF